MRALPAYSRSTPSIALRLDHNTLLASERPFPSSLPAIPKAYVLPFEDSAGPRSFSPTLSQAGQLTGKIPIWLGLRSTCCSASHTPPYHEPCFDRAPTGSVRPPPAPLETL